MQKKHFAWVTVGVICFSISIASYLYSQQKTKSEGFDFVTSDAGATSSLNSLEYSIYKQINNHRLKKGLPPLALNAQLTEQARRNSQLLASNQIAFRKEDVSQANQSLNHLPHHGTSTLIAWNRGYINPAQTTVDIWLTDNSSIKSIEGKYELTGVGIARNAAGKYYVTQILLRR